MNEKLLSVVLPAYNEVQMVHKAIFTISERLKNENIPYELILVDDGSIDHTWKAIEEESAGDSRIRGISFSRNFGKEAAVFAGLAHAEGAAVAVMDCDLQHPVDALILMYRCWEDGYEIVEGIKSYRGKESVMHKASAGLFYKLMSSILHFDMSNASDFKLLDRKAVNEILAMPERNMFFRATSSWVGFKKTSVAFEVQDREAGESKWTTKSLIRYAFTNVASFTTAPLQVVSVLGMLCMFSSLILLIYSLIQYVQGKAVEGYTTILVVLLFVGSAVMMSLGIIGYYIAKIYEEVKHRPRFIISKMTTEKHDKT